MSNELVKLDDLGDLPVAKYSDDDWDAAASGSAFLPRVQLMTSNAGLCKRGEFNTNHYALVRDQKFDDLGKNVDVLVLVWRPKALDTNDGVISVFDPNDKEFERIQEKSLTVKNSNCMFGPEFLIWIPKAATFATFFFGTKSARREAGNMKARLKKPATLGSQFCKNKDFEWFAPEVSACSTPFDMPKKEELMAAIEQFNNPPKNDTENVEDEEETSRAR